MMWRKIRVSGNRKNLDDICAVMSMLSSGLEIEDYSDVSADPIYGELIDEEILNKDKTKVAVSLYISEDKDAEEYISFLRTRFFELGIEALIEQDSIEEQEWENSWKQYYKPVHIGERIVIVPLWEEYSPQKGEIVVKMDPGMAFGTGTHETTRLCIRLLEEYLNAGSLVLDVGTGSGILSICASKLGAEHICAYDIDSTAVRVAKENFENNDCENIECGVSDLLKDVKLFEGQRFDIVLANIVADIIIRMLPDLPRMIRPGTVLLLSGIIAPSADEVRKAAQKYNFEIIEEIQENDWVGLALRYGETAACNR